MRPKVNKIVLTGGHAGSTAYALIEEIKKNNKNYEVSWIGPKYAIEGSTATTYEYKVFPSLGVKFYPIAAGRIQRRFTKYTIPSILRIPLGFIQALVLLTKIKPQAVLSFGGYAAFPVVLAAWFYRIPVIIHEQTIVYGRANKFSSFFADKIALSRHEATAYFPLKKSIVVGNPVSAGIRAIKAKTRMQNPPCILVIGGSRGSRFINSLVENLLPTLLKKYSLVHQTGELEYQKFKKIKSGLTQRLKNKYKVFDFIKPENLSEFMDKADLIISRAGANIVSEIIVAKRPAIFIPLPISFMDEQTKNANYAEKMGFCLVLEQESLTPQVMAEKINQVIKNWESLIAVANETKSLDLDASGRLLDLVNQEIAK